MKTIQISQQDMERRIARFARLKPLPIQNASIPEKARDVVYSRKLLSVVGLETSTPINAGAPIIGAAGMTMTLAVCPPGQGPGLHSHRQTYETFTVMKGRFEVRWNDDGSGARGPRPVRHRVLPAGRVPLVPQRRRRGRHPAGDHHRRRARHDRHRLLGEGQAGDRSGASRPCGRVREDRLYLYGRAALASICASASPIALRIARAAPAARLPCRRAGTPASARA